MIRRKPSLISIASEETISFLMLMPDGSSKTLASLPLEVFLDEGADTADLPEAVMQSVNQMLVVPDYWMGNSFQEFQARKKSVITAFIERKLKLEQPSLTEVNDFYNYAIVKGQGHAPHLYTFYLQEVVAYQVYQRLKGLGISPICITTPALVWQARLDGSAADFAQQGVGFIHLDEADCFLYFFFMGRFLFSRHIQLPDTAGDASETYNLLNYEINQSFYLYSQKTKRSVDTLYMLAADPAAAGQLTDLLGREVIGIPETSPQTDALEEKVLLPSCRGFSAGDLKASGGHCIFYKPLKNELAWRPVQWTGIAVGLLLAALLSFESGFLHLLSGAVERQMHQVTSTTEEPPDIVLQDAAVSLDEITRELARPSGSGTIMRTLLSMPEGVSVRKISLKVSPSPYLEMDAVVAADSPDAFKVILKDFLNRLNQRFNLKAHALKEKDVTIQLDRREGNERHPAYLINFGFEIS